MLLSVEGVVVAAPVNLMAFSLSVTKQDLVVFRGGQIPETACT